MAHWLGLVGYATEKNLLPFNEALGVVHALQLNGHSQWRACGNEGNINTEGG